MGKSTNGPDYHDCEMMMRAMAAVHSGHVELNVRPRGQGLASGVDITLTMHFDVLPGSSVPKIVQVKSVYPCAECSDFWSHVFKGLYGLDFEIGQHYENSKLWQE